MFNVRLHKEITKFGFQFVCRSLSTHFEVNRDTFLILQLYHVTFSLSSSLYFPDEVVAVDRPEVVLHGVVVQLEVGDQSLAGQEAETKRRIVETSY